MVFHQLKFSDVIILAFCCENLWSNKECLLKIENGATGLCYTLVGPPVAHRRQTSWFAADDRRWAPADTVGGPPATNTLLCNTDVRHWADSMWLTGLLGC